MEDETILEDEKFTKDKFGKFVTVNLAKWERIKKRRQAMHYSIKSPDGKGIFLLLQMK